VPHLGWVTIVTTCNICGQEYGLTHSCAEIAPLVTPEEQAPPPNLRFAPGYYFQQAFKILAWDDAAVRRMKAFGLAAAIGITFWILSMWIATNGSRPIR
jgi:hypothetical protein